MGLRVKRRDVGDHDAEAYYSEFPRPAILALAPTLERVDAEGRIVEAEGYYRKKPPKGGRKFCYTPRNAYDFDAGAINAIRSVIDDLRPSWVEEVRDACRISADPRWISAYCEVSPQVVVAIMLNLEARDDLPGEVAS